MKLRILLLLLFILFLSMKTIAVAQNEEWEKLESEGASLYHQSKYQQATEKALSALEVAEKAFGPSHPNVATSLNNLAGLYRAQGQYTEAELLNERSLAIREKAFGPNHPDVAHSLNNLAALYYDQGQTTKAVPLREPLGFRVAAHDRAIFMHLFVRPYASTEQCFAIRSASACHRQRR